MRGGNGGGGWMGVGERWTGWLRSEWCWGCVCHQGMLSRCVLLILLLVIIIIIIVLIIILRLLLLGAVYMIRYVLRMSRISRKSLERNTMSLAFSFRIVEQEKPEEGRKEGRGLIRLLLSTTCEYVGNLLDSLYLSLRCTNVILSPIHTVDQTTLRFEFSFHSLLTETEWLCHSFASVGPLLPCSRRQVWNITQLD